MLILHTADLHIGKYAKVPKPLERQAAALTQITQLAIDRAVRLVLICGDVFDHEGITHVEKDVVWRWLIDLDTAGKEHGFETIVIPGNHDKITTNYTQLRPVVWLTRAGHLPTVTVIEQEPQLVRVDSVWVAAVPAGEWTTERLESAILKLHHQATRLAQGEPVRMIAALHAAVAGSTNDDRTWWPTSLHLSPEWPVNLFALGDVHMSQQVEGLPHAWYCGSPIQHTFGDRGERGVLIHDTDSQQPPELVQLDVPRMVTVTTTNRSEIPEDDIVCVAAPPGDLATADLPNNVVLTKPVVDDTPASVAIDLDQLDGFSELLQELGLDADDQELALSVVRHLGG